MQRQRLFLTVVIVLIAAGIFLFFREDKVEEEVGVEEEVKVEDVTRELASQLGVTIPEDVERTALRDVRDQGATGLATRSYTDGLFTHTVLAALPDLTTGAMYQGWLVRGAEGEENYSVVPTGKLRVSKGGYLLEFSNSADLRDHSKIWVTVEVQDDGKPETKLLEGSF